MAKFNMPTQTPVKKLDIDNFQGLDSKSLNPEYYRAQDMKNFIKKDGLHQLRPGIIQTYPNPNTFIDETNVALSI